MQASDTAVRSFLAGNSPPDFQLHRHRSHGWSCYRGSTTFQKGLALPFLKKPFKKNVFFTAWQFLKKEIK
jgi:hypothetical protein